MTLQIEPFFGQNKDNRQDLDTIIEKKIETSLEKFFYKFDKMLETAMQDAVKKISEYWFHVPLLLYCYITSYFVL